MLIVGNSMCGTIQQPEWIWFWESSVQALFDCCMLFFCQVSVVSKGRRGTMKRTSRKIFKLVQKFEKLWTISWLPELQVRAHEIHLCFTANLLIVPKKAQPRSVPVSLQWLLLPSCSFQLLERGNTLKEKLFSRSFSWFNAIVAMNPLLLPCIASFYYLSLFLDVN